MEIYKKNNDEIKSWQKDHLTRVKRLKPLVFVSMY